MKLDRKTRGATWLLIVFAALWASVPALRASLGPINPARFGVSADEVALIHELVLQNPGDPPAFDQEWLAKWARYRQLCRDAVSLGRDKLARAYIAWSLSTPDPRLPAFIDGDPELADLVAKARRILAHDLAKYYATVPVVPHDVPNCWTDICRLHISGDSEDARLVEAVIENVKSRVTARTHSLPTQLENVRKFVQSGLEGRHLFAKDRESRRGHFFLGFHEIAQSEFFEDIGLVYGVTAEDRRELEAEGHTIVPIENLILSAESGEPSEPPGHSDLWGWLVLLAGALSGIAFVLWLRQKTIGAGVEP